MLAFDGTLSGPGVPSWIGGLGFADAEPGVPHEAEADDVVNFVVVATTDMGFLREPLSNFSESVSAACSDKLLLAACLCLFTSAR